MNNQVVPNKKSIMMDQVLQELRDLVTTLVVKQGYKANRMENIDMTRYGDQYCAAINHIDVFYSYNTYSEYALNKAGLYELKYRRDKSTIPKDKRNLVLNYQREYIITTYEEKNNYYRSLAGLPDIGDDFIYIKNNYEGVDETKPIHLMDKDEITVLIVKGEIDRLIKENPDKEYLKHLDYDKRIPINVAREANDFDILYIKKDRNKQGVSDSFIGIYRAVRSYVLERFYDEAFTQSSPYYDAFIGLFILTITVQRYMITYMEKFINRDFFNKDIIRLLFESYGLPFYKNIPLSYFQKVSKNLNRLLYYKATDRVFADIFKIFDLDNIDIYNYILFKDRKLDINGEPINIYKEKTDVGYQIDTNTYALVNESDFFGIRLENLDNIKKIVEINGCRLYLFNNGLLDFDKNINLSLLKDMYTDDNDYPFKQFTGNKNINDIIELKGKNYHKLIFTINDDCCKFYVFDNKEPIEYHDIPKSIDNNPITSIGFAIDRINDNMCFYTNTSLNGYLYFKGNICRASYDAFTLINKFEAPIFSIGMGYESIILVDNNNKAWVLGDNEFNRLHVPFKNYIMNWEPIDNRIYMVNYGYIFLKGAVFIMADGSVRMTGEVPEINPNIHTTPGENEILTEYSGIKCLQFWYNAKITSDAYIFIEFSGKIHITNYNIYDTIGKLIYKSDVENPEIRFKFIKNIAVIENGLLITTYTTDKWVYYSGENENKVFPFIKTKNMIKEDNLMKMKDIEIYDNILYFITYDNRLIQYTSSDEYTVLPLPKEQIQLFKQAGGYLILTVGKQYFYIADTNYGIIKLNTKNIFVSNVFVENNKFYLEDKNNLLYEAVNFNTKDLKDLKTISEKDLVFKKISFYECTHSYNNKIATLTPKIENNILKYYLCYKDLENNIDITKQVTNVYNCRQLTINIGTNRIYLDGKFIQYIDISKFIDGSSTNFIFYDEINRIRAWSERINDHLVIYNKTGGITVFKDFPHLENMDCGIYFDGNYISIYDDENLQLTDITFNDTNIVQLQSENTRMSYEPVVEKMYDLKFITAPLDTTNLSEQFANSGNYLDYNLVTYNDKLWGGDGDRSDFLNEVLNSEFNYVTSKYISVDCRYNLTKLNFEICYMFRMLADLKPNEKYLEFDIPYVGKVRLFDCIVAIYQLTCFKMGFEGYIMDTTTKTLSVLGFNFNQDFKYIQEIYKEYNLKERFPELKLDDVDIQEPPVIFQKSIEVVNTFLNNMDVVEAVYDYKYKTKNIYAYNAMKKIENATVFTKYSTDMYRREDGSLPETYMDYLQENNPDLWRYLSETDDENLIEQVDNLLVALDNYLKSDKFKFLFLNIPTLSLDNIRRFIYYLVDVFKSYTVDLKALNIIYEIDDKRIHNIKLILWEDQFLKYFRRYTKLELRDRFSNMFPEEYLRTKIDMFFRTIPEGKFTIREYDYMFKLFKALPDKITTVSLPLLSDFADEFDRMDGIFGYNKRLQLELETIFESMIPIIEKGLLKLRESDEFELLTDLDIKKELELILKEYRLSEFYRKDKLTLSFKDKLKSEYHINNQIIERIFNYDFSNPNKYYDKRDILPLDISDHDELDSKINRFNRISINDSYYFIYSNKE